MKLCKMCGEQKGEESFRLSEECRKCETKRRSRRRAERAGREYKSLDEIRWLKTEGKKRCGSCREVKFFEEFYKCRATHDGYKQNCKECKKKEPRYPSQKTKYERAGFIL